ncbi:hypothetical protein C0991_005676, partial [Blastosporella zonata]
MPVLAGMEGASELASSPDKKGTLQLAAITQDDDRTNDLGIRCAGGHMRTENREESETMDVASDGLRRSSRIASRKSRTVPRAGEGTEGGNGDDWTKQTNKCRQSKKAKVNLELTPGNNAETRQDQHDDIISIPELASPQTYIEMSRLMSNIDINECVKFKYQDDATLKSIYKAPEQHKNFH